MAKIVFVARHGVGFADDEGAITHALTALGHEVVCIHERKGKSVRHIRDADLLLFLKWDDAHALSQARCPRAFWYFDLVDWPSDPTLARRCAQRRAWMERITPLVDVGFCTDGDWVAADTTGKLVWLPQGADERVIGRGDNVATEPPVPILFTGTARGGGRVRESFVAEMAERYGDDFRHVRPTPHHPGYYQRDLARLIASAQIVVAPDGPVTDRYWSNRVYNALGFGAFLLHPYCRELAKSYEDRREVVYYHSRDDLHRLIAHYRALPEAARREVSEGGLRRTLAGHTYRHRCEELLRVCRERGLVPS